MFGRRKNFRIIYDQDRILITTEFFRVNEVLNLKGRFNKGSNFYQVH